MAEGPSKLFTNYWEFIQKRNEFGSIKRPVVRWYPSSGLNQFQSKVFDFVKESPTVLDFGAGDLSLKGKFTKAGFRGKYFTCDVSKDFKYDFSSLEEIVQKKIKFDAILVLEVIEHLNLAEFEKFLPVLVSLVNPGGRLVISTPNAHSINSVWSTDLTHVKSYPHPDLWALFTLKGFDCRPYRVIWTRNKWMSPMEKVKYEIGKVLTHFLGVDYAVGIALMCEKKT
jgi:SAM-dependent methyltransferase